MSNPSSGIDIPFLKSLEGDEVVAYVPAAGKSGVTIGMGFDIGQHSVDQLWTMFANRPTFIRFCAPYAGQKGGNAERALKALPLVLTEPERDEMNRLVKAYHLRKIEIAWTGSSPSVPWSTLTVPQRTVVASVCWQHGAVVWARPYRFWAQATSGDWPAVIANLRNFGDDYPTRRRREADFLAESMPDA